MIILSRSFLTILVLGLAVPMRSWARPGEEVVVVYNRDLADSKNVADYYAQRRDVPKGQVFGFDLPTTEAMTRAEYEDHLAKPLLHRLREEHLFVYGSGHSGGAKNTTNEVPVESK